VKLERFSLAAWQQTWPQEKEKFVAKAAHKNKKKSEKKNYRIYADIKSAHDLPADPTLRSSSSWGNNCNSNSIQFHIWCGSCMLQASTHGSLHQDLSQIKAAKPTTNYQLIQFKCWPSQELHSKPKWQIAYKLQVAVCKELLVFLLLLLLLLLLLALAALGTLLVLPSCQQQLPHCRHREADKWLREQETQDLDSDLESDFDSKLKVETKA